MGISSAETGPIWFPFDLDWAGVEELSSKAVTIEPAGSRGFIEVGKDGHYFSGSKRIRFFGAQIPPTLGGDGAKVLGKRLVSYGFNLWRGCPPYMTPDTKDEIDRFDSFFDAMKTNGLYSYLQLHGGGRLLRAASYSPQLVDFFGLSQRHIGDLKKGFGSPNHPDILLAYLMEPTIVNAERRIWKGWLEHVNPYTKLAYKDEAAILCIELTNECYLLGAWEMGMLGLGVFPEYYEGYFQELWNRYLIDLVKTEMNRKGGKTRGQRSEVRGRKSEGRKGQRSPQLNTLGGNPVQRGREVAGQGIRDWLRVRWDDGTGVGLFADEDPVQGTVKRLPERPQRDKGNKFSRTRTLDLMAFYAFLQKRYFDESRNYLVPERKFGISLFAWNSYRKY